MNHSFYFKRLLIGTVLFSTSIQAFSQRGFNYYKDSSRVGSPNQNAYIYFKKAYYDHIWKWTNEGVDSAEYYLKLAIKEDSNYSAAYAFLAHVYQFKTYTSKDRDKVFALEKKYAQKAISFNPKTGDAYSVMSDVLWEEKDTVGALTLLRKAIASEPDNVGNYFWIATRYRQMVQENYIDSSIMALHRIIELDPEYGQAYMKLGSAYQWGKPVFDSAKYYYRKTTEIYNTVKPKDNRLMDGYFWLGEIYKLEKKYDSAAYYYNLFLKEMEPIEMYVRELRLSMTYKALYECYQGLAKNRLNQFINLNEKRIANNSNDAKYLLNILEGESGGFMTIEQDSIAEKYSLPLARRLQKMQSADPYIEIFAITDEFLLLNRLKRNKEAMIVLNAAHAKYPNDPLILFEMGRAYVISNKPNEGIAYLQRSKQNLNDVIKREYYDAWLKEPDFDKIRNTAAFKKLSE